MSPSPGSDPTLETDRLVIYFHCNGWCHISIVTPIMTMELNGCLKGTLVLKCLQQSCQGTALEVKISTVIIAISFAVFALSAIFCNKILLLYDPQRNQVLENENRNRAEVIRQEDPLCTWTLPQSPRQLISFSDDPRADFAGTD
eukprot:m.51121 g.51121  ORF g.51121 m.51121 type:complete len:144 (+) comp34114_c0_seq1:427-858(+)